MAAVRPLPMPPERTKGEGVGGEGDGEEKQSREEGEAASKSAKKIAKRQIQGWRVLEALTSTPSVAQALMQGACACERGRLRYNTPSPPLLLSEEKVD